MTFSTSSTPSYLATSPSALAIPSSASRAATSLIQNPLSTVHRPRSSKPMSLYSPNDSADDMRNVGSLSSCAFRSTVDSNVRPMPFLW